MTTSIAAPAGFMSASSRGSVTTPCRWSRRAGCPTPDGRAAELFDACIPAVPYAAATAFLGREKFKLTRTEGDRPRVALVADGLGSTHGVAHAIQQIGPGVCPGSRSR